MRMGVVAAADRSGRGCWPARLTIDPSLAGLAGTVAVVRTDEPPPGCDARQGAGGEPVDHGSPFRIFLGGRRVGAGALSEGRV
jgi:hypothetical protein